MKTRFFIFSLALFVSALCAKAQVTVGSVEAPQGFSILELISSERGLRLPQLTTLQRDAITTDAFKANVLAKGLVIYNTTTNCVEYWNKTKWVSLCTGQANISFTDGGGNPVDPTQPPFPPAGETKGPFVPTDEPPCTTLDPAYTFLVISGADYFHIDVLNTATGEFTATMDENPSVSPRTAILRVTNACTNEYSEFLFTQEGNTGICEESANAPVINAPNGLSLCAGGAVYLELTSPTPAVDYIWTLGGVEKGRGTSFVATQAGAYTVYAGGIGCTTPTPATATVTASATSAPSAIAIIVGQNQGYVCDAGSTTQIYAQTPTVGTLMWFMDGVYQSGITQTVSGAYTYIEAGIGTWFAAVGEGGCSSKKSNEIVVSVDPNAGTAIAAPAFTINGHSNAAPVTVCQGGTLLLAVTAPNGSYTYSWYVNNTLKGTGATYELSMSGITSDFVLQCRAEGSSSCASSGVAQINVAVGYAPAAPSINSGSATASICGANPAVLNASGGGTEYKWYKNGVEIVGATSSVYSTTEPGNYTVRVKNSSDCWSALSSNTVNVINNGAISLVWAIEPVDADAIVGSSKSYSVNASPTPDSYTWTSSNPTAASVTPTGNGSSATVDYLTTASNVTLTVSATNACGTVNLSKTLTSVTTSCASITAATLSPSGTVSKLTTDGATLFTAGASNGTTPYEYEFYVNDTKVQNKGTTNTYTLPATAGTYTVYAKAYNACTPTGIQTATTTVTYTEPIPVPTAAGSGSLTGKTCFDIYKSNFDADCGTQTARAAQATNFASLGTVTYTFTKSATGTVDNVRYVIVDNEGCVTSSKQGTITMSGSTGTISVDYKTTLSETTDIIYGRNRNNAAKVNIYIVYNNGTQDVQVGLTVSIQDCVCCGAATVDNSWLTFMCHNLGANEALNPFEWNSTANNNGYDIKGDLYQWGRYTDGHEKRNSPYTSSGKPTLSAYNAEVLAYKADPSDAIAYTSFYTNSSSPYDWISDGATQNTASSRQGWGDATTNLNQTKAANDPCPPGWKVPSQAQWGSIFQGGTIYGTPNSATANSWSYTGTFHGYMVGSSLFLPAAGYRNYSTGALNYVGSIGYYWSSTWYSNTYSYYLYFSSSYVYPGYSNRRAFGFSVRCVSE